MARRSAPIIAIRRASDTLDLYLVAESAINPPTPVDIQPGLAIVGFEDLIVRGALLELFGPVDTLIFAAIDEED